MSSRPPNAHADRLLWAGIACFVVIVAGGLWLAPRLIGPGTAAAQSDGSLGSGAK